MPAWVAFVKHLGTDLVGFPVFVEDQFALGRRGLALRPGLRKSGSGPSCAADFHDCQSELSEHVDTVLARWNLASLHGIEMGWYFEVSNDLIAGALLGANHHAKSTVEFLGGGGGLGGGEGWGGGGKTTIAVCRLCLLLIYLNLSCVFNNHS